MSANQKTSVTTTGLKVGDSEVSRHPTQTDADGNAASDGKQMPASRYAGKPDSINTGIAASQPSELRPVTVQPVDRRTIEGSTPGDFCKNVSHSGDAAMAKIANPPGPREGMRGQRNSRSYDENGKSFQNFPGNLTDSDGGN